MYATLCPPQASCIVRRLNASGRHFVTSYDLDMQGAQGDVFDNAVGKPTRRRGKKCLGIPGHALSVAPLTANSAFMAPRLEAKGEAQTEGRAPGVRGGHVPGYMGHVPENRPYRFDGGQAQQRSHEKSFFLLPDNFRQQVPGYTGRNMDYSNFSAGCDRGRH